MTIIEDNPDVNPDVTSPEEAVESASILERVKARRDDAPDFLTIDIPTWNGELKAKYQVVDRDDIEAMVRRIRARQSGDRRAASEAAVQADLDFLIKACVGVIAHDNDTDEEEFLTPGYTAQLTNMLGKADEIKTARELVSYLIKHNSIAIAAHGQKIAKWMQDTSRPVEDPS